MDGTVRLWDAATGEAVLALRGPRYGVASVAWSPDGNRLASCEGTPEGTDCCIRLWER
jgi:WD40 repeat protein